MRDVAICASWMAATRSYSARVMVCPRELVESSTRYVDRLLRESTRALTFTFPNSVTEAFGISSVSSRNRAAVGFHSTREPFTWYATLFPPPGHTRRARRHAARARWRTRASKASTISWILPGIGKIIALGFPPERRPSSRYGIDLIA